MTELDVRKIPASQRHGVIFERFDGLRSGEGFVLVNDHDPKPLYYQFKAELPGEFSWEYCENGPEVWKVAIGKKAENTSDADIGEKKVGEIVAEDYRAAEVFRRHNIDFCCGGNKSVRSACEEKGITMAGLARELEIARRQGSAERYNDWEPDFLADYIVNEFHSHSKKMLPQITEFAEKVAEVHGENHPETRTIAETWRELAGSLAMHTQKEELLLFPYIKQLVQVRKEGGTVRKPVFDSAETLIRTMVEEHDAAGGGLGEIERLSGGFMPPEDACNTFKTLYAWLRDFDEQTKKHVHLENNILYPKALRLEKEI